MISSDPAESTMITTLKAIVKSKVIKAAYPDPSAAAFSASDKYGFSIK